MATSETIPRDRSKSVKLAFYLLLGFLGLFISAVLLLFSISVYVNTQGEIPDPLRAEPAELIDLAKKNFVPPASHPAPSQTPLPPSAELESRRQSYRQTVGEIDTLKKSFDLAFQNGINSAMTPAMLDWLTAHAAELAAMHEFLKGDDPEKRDAIFRVTQGFSADPYSYDPIGRLQNWNRILTRVTQWKLKQRDYPAAREAILDSLKLIDWGTHDCPLWDTTAEFWMASLFITKAVEDRNYPADQFTGIPEAVEKLEIQLFDPKAVLNEMIFAYLAERKETIKRLDEPWNSSIFGWTWDDRQFYYRTNFYWPNGAEIKIPKTIVYAQYASEAMEKKRHAADALKIFDEEKKRQISRFQMPYAQQKATAKADFEQTRKNREQTFFPIGPNPSEAGASQFRYYETQIRVVRAGMLWRIDPQRARVTRAENLKANPHHPWLDPYTEEPLCIDETSTETLIYSLGPTLKPEDGRRYLNTHIHLPTN